MQQRRREVEPTEIHEALKELRALSDEAPETLSDEELRAMTDQQLDALIDKLSDEAIAELA